MSLCRWQVKTIPSAIHPSCLQTSCNNNTPTLPAHSPACHAETPAPCWCYWGSEAVWGHGLAPWAASLQRGPPAGPAASPRHADPQWGSRPSLEAFSCIGKSWSSWRMFCIEFFLVHLKSFIKKLIFLFHYLNQQFPDYKTRMCVLWFQDSSWLVSWIFLLYWWLRLSMTLTIQSYSTFESVSIQNMLKDMLVFNRNMIDPSVSENKRILQSRHFCNNPWEVWGVQKVSVMTCKFSLWIQNVIYI